MTSFHTSPKKRGIKSLLAALTLTAMFLPTAAFSAERDGTTLFFSLEDLRRELTTPSLSSLSSILTWRNQEENTDRRTPIERNLTWGNGLGIDGYAHPGSHRPLWGY
jgi:hypothetical protein